MAPNKYEKYLRAPEGVESLEEDKKGKVNKYEKYIKKFDYKDLPDDVKKSDEAIVRAEKKKGNKDVNWLVSTGAAVGSGLLKLGQGTISLGTLLLDAGLNTNITAAVDSAFGWIDDKVGNLEEKAQSTIIGNITEVLVQYGTPYGIARKIAQNALKGAAKNATRGKNKLNLYEKRAGVPRNLTVKEEMATIGAAETVAVTSDYDSITGLSIEDKGLQGREEAARLLFNKFVGGAEGVAAAGILFGGVA